jgi:DNA-binding CsgD family transcriptional regulator
MGKGKVWSGAEITFLRRHYSDMHARDIATALDRSEKSVRSKAAMLGLKAKSRTHSPIAKVQQLKADGLTIAEIAERLQLTIGRIYYCLYKCDRASSLYTPRSITIWTEERAEKLICLARKKTPTNIIAEKLGVTVSAVHHKAHQLKIHLHGNRRYSQRDIDQVHQMWSAGCSVREIARKLGGQPTLISMVRRILSNESPSWEGT